MKSDQFNTAFIFVISFLILVSLGFTLMLYFPMQMSPDIQSYLGLADGEWDQNPIRKYRVIIPMLAAGVNYCLQPLLSKIQPWNFEGNFSLCFSFMLVNSMLMAIVSIFIYKIGEVFSLNKLSNSILLISFLTNRWTLEITALPLIDSLYLLALTTALYGILAKREFWVLFSILIGPWSKEAYIFFIPVLLYASWLLVRKRIFYIAISGMFIFGFRSWWDWRLEQKWDQSIFEILSSFSTIPDSLNRLFSAHGLYELFSVTGVWTLLIFWAFWKSKSLFLQMICSHGTWLYWTFFPMVLLQALLSGDLGRMFYIAIPLSSIWIGSAFQSLYPDRIWDTKKET
ncbi:MAG: hypothetical protein IPM34_03125 [Saprospiraceae bacterium]|nr:hypothetical protein [Saprospiraceae bacterium]